MSIVMLTKDNFDQVLDSNEIMVVDFWAEWCAPCKSFAQVYEEVAAQHPDIVFGQINVDEEKELALDFEVRSIPLLMILRESIMVFRQSGVLPASALNDLIAQARALDMTKVRESAK